MTRPAVTVITIFRDAMPYLQEAVDSVLAQTCDDWELLLVDDGSSDGSGELAHELSRSHRGQVRCLRHPGGENRGMSASRNLGLTQARGRAIAFLDGDDVYLPHKLEIQLELLGRHPEAGMVHGPMTLWWSWTGKPEHIGHDRVRDLRLPVDVVLPPPWLVRAYVRGEAGTPATCAVLLRRETLERVGGFVPTFRGLYEDQVFFHKVARHLPVVVTDVPGDLYRQHDRSATQRSLASGHWRRDAPNEASTVFLEWLDGYLAAECPSDLRSRLVVRRQLVEHRHPRLVRLRTGARSRLGAVRRRLLKPGS